MEPETELDAVLIDEFDAGTAPAHALRVDEMLLRRKPPAPGSLRTLRADETPSYTFPVSDNRSMLRHYPSLDDIPAPAPAPSRRYEAPEVAARPTSYPRFESLGSSLPEAKNVTPSVVPTQDARSHHETVQEPVNEPPRNTATVAAECEVEQAQTTQVVSPTTTQSEMQVQGEAATPQQVLESMPSDQELEHQRRLVEAELRRFQQQADYVALALAGNTPHQKEMRRLRELERQEREERRLAALETRIEHMVERELQREARQEERRQRHAERAHRSSVSPSPERERFSDENAQEEVMEGNVAGIEPK